MNKGIPPTVVGTVLFLVGGYLAYSFYNYETGIVTTTLWREVITFSVISIVGLTILLYGIKKLIKKN
jgi:hypothetical protein